MARKKQNQPAVRKLTNSKIADAKRIRFGGGMAPACLALARNADAATRDKRRIRFGGGMISAALKK